MKEKKADIALAGLGVMGANLARNMKNKGFSVAVYDLEEEKIQALEAEGFTGCRSPKELADSLEKPRIIFALVPAGKPVEDLFSSLVPVLEPGDIFIDGGNSHYKDTERRCAEAAKAGLYYVGCGVSGGEEGALHGPCLMPGGNAQARPLVEPILQAVCARTESGEPCCSWIGEGGAGHFVKMVHNGIEYGDMQLICEVWQLLEASGGLSHEEAGNVFGRWQKTGLESYLIDITSRILKHREADGSFTLDHILDRAGQKGTGKWTAAAALEEGVPLTLIAEAVFARFLSGDPAGRRAAAARFPKPAPAFAGTASELEALLQNALYAAKILSYAQGFALLKTASDRYGWNLDYSAIAGCWRGGCIIRSVFLENIRQAYAAHPGLCDLTEDAWFAGEIRRCLPDFRRAVSLAVLSGIPAPALSAALSWFDGRTCGQLPANLLQAQRDFFGAHTYERTDRPEGEFFHTKWTD